MSAFYFLLGILFYYYYFKKYKDVIHPIGVFLFIWYCTCGISVLPITNFFASWSFPMHLICIVSGISFFIGNIIYECLTYKHIHTFKRIPSKKRRNSCNIIIVLVIFIISSLAFIYEWKQGGSKIILSNLGKETYDLKGNIYGNTNMVIHFIARLVPISAIYSFYIILKYKGRFLFFKLVIIFAIIFFSLAVNFSRGDLMIYFAAFIFLYSRFHQIKLKRIIIFILCLLFIFVLIALWRVKNTESLLYTSTSNPYISSIYSYITCGFANLNDLVNSDIEYHWGGNMTFQPLWSLLHLKDNFECIKFEQYEFFNSLVYIYAFYHDFKVIGIIVFPLLLGFFLSHLYFLSLTNSNYNLCLAVWAKAFMVPFFGNYFFGSIDVTFLFIVTLIVSFLFDKCKLHLK